MSSTAAWAASSSAGTPSSRKGERGCCEGEGGEEEAFWAPQAAERANSSCGSQPEASQASPTSLEKAPGMVLKALTQDRSCGLRRERGREEGEEAEEKKEKGKRVGMREREKLPAPVASGKTKNVDDDGKKKLPQKK